MNDYSFLRFCSETGEAQKFKDGRVEKVGTRITKLFDQTSERNAMLRIVGGRDSTLLETKEFI